MEVLCISTAQARRLWWVQAGAFSDLVVTFGGRVTGNLEVWWSKVRLFVAGAGARSGFIYFDVQISWQAQCFGHGGAVNCDFWTRGSFSWPGAAICAP